LATTPEMMIRALPWPMAGPCTSTTPARTWSPAARAGGNGFAAMSRTGLLAILQRRCAQVGVPVHFRSEIADVDALAADHDLVVAADGRAPWSGPGTPTLCGPRCKPEGAGTSGWAPTWCLTRSGSTSWTHRAGSCRCTPTLIPVRPAPSSWSCPNTPGAAGFAGIAPAQLAQGGSDERSIGIIADRDEQLRRRPSGQDSTRGPLSASRGSRLRGARI
jgi:anthraniloyl-CoA monooxygenase